MCHLISHLRAVSWCCKIMRTQLKAASVSDQTRGCRRPLKQGAVSHLSESGHPAPGRPPPPVRPQQVRQGVLGLFFGPSPQLCDSYMTTIRQLCDNYATTMRQPMRQLCDIYVLLQYCVYSIKKRKVSYFKLHKIPQYCSKM